MVTIYRRKRSFFRPFSRWTPHSRLLAIKSRFFGRHVEFHPLICTTLKHAEVFIYLSMEYVTLVAQPKYQLNISSPTQTMTVKRTFIEMTPCVHLAYRKSLFYWENYINCVENVSKCFILLPMVNAIWKKIKNKKKIKITQRQTKGNSCFSAIVVSSVVIFCCLLIFMGTKN